jgi:hypothetical protein
VHEYQQVQPDVIEFLHETGQLVNSPPLLLVAGEAGRHVLESLVPVHPLFSRRLSQGDVSIFGSPSVPSSRISFPFFPSRVLHSHLLVRASLASSKSKIALPLVRNRNPFEGIVPPIGICSSRLPARRGFKLDGCCHLYPPRPWNTSLPLVTIFVQRLLAHGVSNLIIGIRQSWWRLGFLWFFFLSFIVLSEHPSASTRLQVASLSS